ncbi:34843_t:CDS:1, partial [Racocetra persica]
GCVLINDELADSNRWVLCQTKQATGGYVPAIIITDTDPALDLAISEKYEQSYAMHCIFHISQNFPQNLEAKLGQQYQEFVQDFYTARNSFVLEVFKQKWKQLIKKYNEPRV